VTRAQVALAWLRTNLVVTAPLVGASSTQQIDDAVMSLDIELTSDDFRALHARHDFQGISDDDELQAIMARLPQFIIAR
jgi:aryl-alcohol dehydrogenase-like predicted oxidoreductase